MEITLLPKLKPDSTLADYNGSTSFHHLWTLLLQKMRLIKKGLNPLNMLWQVINFQCLLMEIQHINQLSIK